MDDDEEITPEDMARAVLKNSYYHPYGPTLTEKDEKALAILRKRYKISNDETRTKKTKRDS